MNAEYRGMIDEPSIAALRKQAQALAFQWLTARSFHVHPDGAVIFQVRASDLDLQRKLMRGMLVKVAVTFEKDE